MSSLIEVLKQIQERDDLDSRTEARVVFDRMSRDFEAAVRATFEHGTHGDLVIVASENMLMSEYWMNQWVGSDPRWHGDWGKDLRAAVRDIKAGTPNQETMNEMSWHGSAKPLERDEEAYQANLAAQQRETETAPGEESLLVGVVKSGRWTFDATKNLATGEVLYTTKNGEKGASDRIAKTFQRR